MEAKQGDQNKGTEERLSKTKQGDGGEVEKG